MLALTHTKLVNSLYAYLFDAKTLWQQLNDNKTKSSTSKLSNWQTFRSFLMLVV